MDDKDLIDHLRLLRPTKGDTLLLTTDSLPKAQQDALVRLLRRWRDENGWELEILWIKPPSTLETVDEESMRRAGWVKAPKQLGVQVCDIVPAMTDGVSFDVVSSPQV